MAKKEDLTLIIGKSFAKSVFTHKEVLVCKDITMSLLINDYGLNDIQANEVINWCVLQQSQRNNTQLQYTNLNENFSDVFSSSSAVSIDAILNQIATRNDLKSLRFWLIAANVLRIQYLNLNEFMRLPNNVIKKIRVSHVNNDRDIKNYLSHKNMQTIDVTSFSELKTYSLSLSKILTGIILETRKDLENRNDKNVYTPQVRSARKEKPGFFKRIKNFMIGESVTRQQLARFVNILGRVLICGSKAKFITENMSDKKLTSFKESFSKQLFDYTNDKQTAINILNSMSIIVNEFNMSIKQYEAKQEPKSTGNYTDEDFSDTISDNLYIDF